MERGKETFGTGVDPAREGLAWGERHQDSERLQVSGFGSYFRPVLRDSQAHY